MIIQIFSWCLYDHQRYFPYRPASASCYWHTLLNPYHCFYRKYSSQIVAIFKYFEAAMFPTVAIVWPSFEKARGGPLRSTANNPEDILTVDWPAYGWISFPGLAGDFTILPRCVFTAFLSTATRDRGGDEKHNWIGTVTDKNKLEILNWLAGGQFNSKLFATQSQTQKNVSEINALVKFLDYKYRPLLIFILRNNMPNPVSWLFSNWSKA